MIKHKHSESLVLQTLSCLLGMLLLLASVCGAANAATQQVMLDSTWSEFDPVNLGAGVQTLSNNSSSGFTSQIIGAVSDLTERPRVYQQFAGVDTSQIGQKLSVSFDVQFHDLLTMGDTQFRFGFADSTTNQGLVPIMIDMGPSAGSTFRMRYDSSVSVDANDNATTFDPTNWAGFLSASGTFGGGGGNPTGTPEGSLGVDTSVIHTFTTTIERVERNVDTNEDGIGDFVMNGLYTTVTWTNDVTDAEVLFVDTNNLDFSFEDPETELHVYPDDVFNERGRIENIDALGFHLFNNQPFADGDGSYSISNFVAEYDDGALAADFDEDLDVDADDFGIWNTNYGLSGSATKMLGDANEDMDVDGEDYLTWQGEYTGPLTPALIASSSVPEPSSLLLLFSGVALHRLVRRKQGV